MSALCGYHGEPLAGTQARHLAHLEGTGSNDDVLLARMHNDDALALPTYSAVALNAGLRGLAVPGALHEPWAHLSGLLEAL